MQNETTRLDPDAPEYRAWRRSLGLPETYDALMEEALADQARRMVESANPGKTFAEVEAIEHTIDAVDERSLRTDEIVDFDESYGL